MKRTLRLLALLVLFLAPAALWDRRVAAPAPEAVRPPSLDSDESIEGLRVPLADARGARSGVLTGERAERVGRDGLRMRLHGFALTVTATEHRPWAASVITAPWGDVRFDVPPNVAGSVLSMLRSGRTLPTRSVLGGGVTITADDGTRCTTDSVIVEHGPDGQPTAIVASGAVTVTGPGLDLAAAGLDVQPQGEWRLRGPVHGTVAGGAEADSLLRQLPGTARPVERLGDARLECHSPGDVGMRPGADGGWALATADGHPTLLVQRRPTDGAPQIALQLERCTLELRPDAASPGRLRLHAIDASGIGASFEPLATGEVSPTARYAGDLRGSTDAGGRSTFAFAPTGPVWIRAGATVAANQVPAAPSGDRQSLADGIYVVDGAVVTVERHPTEQASQLQARGGEQPARLQVVRLSDAPSLAAAMAPLAVAATTGEALTRWLALRPPDPSDLPFLARVAGPELHASIAPAKAELAGWAWWSLPQGGTAELRRLPGQWVRVEAPSAMGRLDERSAAATADAPARTWWDLAIDCDRGATVGQLARLGTGQRWLVLQPGPDGAPCRVRRSGDGPETTLTLTCDGRAELRDERLPADWKPGAQLPDERAVAGALRADRIEVDASGTPATVTHLLALGNVEGTAAPADGGAPAVMRGDAIEGWRDLRAEGCFERWRWSGFREAQAPSATVFDLGGGPWAIDAAPGETWRLAAPSAEATRRLVREDGRLVPDQLTVLAPQGCTLTRHAQRAGETIEVGRCTLSDAQLGFGRDGAGRSRLTQFNGTGPVTLRDGPASAPVLAATAMALAMQAGPTDGGGWIETWEFGGAPAHVRWRSDYRSPLARRRAADPAAPVANHCAAGRVLWTREWDDLAAVPPLRERWQAAGHPVRLEQGPWSDGTPGAVEWVCSADAIDWWQDGPTRKVEATGNVRCINLDGAGNEQARVTSPHLVSSGRVGPDGRAAGGGAEFAAPFVADGLAATDAYAAFNRPGGQAPSGAARFRIVCPGGARLVAAGDGPRSTDLVAETVFLSVLRDDGTVDRTFKVAQGLRITEDAGGRWAFTLPEGQVATTPTAQELAEVERLASTR